MREAMCAYFFVFSACLEAVPTRLLTRAILSPCVTTTSLSINRPGKAICSFYTCTVCLNWKKAQQRQT